MASFHWNPSPVVVMPHRQPIRATREPSVPKHDLAPIPDEGQENRYPGPRAATAETSEENSPAADLVGSADIEFAPTESPKSFA